jgi:hypothetical protein
MYRCYFTRRGRILSEIFLETALLPEAIAMGHRLLKERAQSQDLDGIEIWYGGKLLYGSAGQIFGQKTMRCHNGFG